MEFKDVEYAEIDRRIVQMDLDRVMEPIIAECIAAKAKRRRLWRYTIKMLVAFLVGMYAVVSASRNAADGNWTAVFVLGVLVFVLFSWMALASVKAEREAGKQ